MHQLACLGRWSIHPNATLFKSLVFRPEAQIVCSQFLETLPALSSTGSPWYAPVFDTASQVRAAAGWVGIRMRDIISRARQRRFRVPIGVDGWLETPSPGSNL